MIKNNPAEVSEAIHKILNENILHIQKFPALSHGNLNEVLSVIKRSFKKFNIDNIKIKSSDLKWLDSGLKLSDDDICCIFMTNFCDGMCSIDISRYNIEKLLQEISNVGYLDYLSNSSMKLIFNSIVTLIVKDMEEALGSLNFSLYQKGRMFTPLLYIDITLSIGDVDVTVNFFMSEEAYSSWNAKHVVKFEKDIQKLPFPEKLMLNTSYIAGESKITAEEFKNLSAGDCILLQWGSFPMQNCLISVEFDDIPMIRGVLQNDHSVKIEEIIMNVNEDKTNKNSEKESAASIEKALSELDVLVKAEIFSEKMPLSQVASLSPGNILPVKIDGSVLLRANGVSFARGVIVKVGENFGVQIVNDR